MKHLLSLSKSIKLIYAIIVLMFIPQVLCISADEGEISVMDYKCVSSELSKHDVWIIPQPKSVSFGSGFFKIKDSIDLSVMKNLDDDPILMKHIVSLVEDNLKADIDTNAKRKLIVGLFPEVKTDIKNINDIDELNEQGYLIDISEKQIAVAANTRIGIFYAIQSLRQIVGNRKSIPVMRITDWPSMPYRGVQYDISRGQMPTFDCLMSLSDTLAKESKSNVFELYIEDTFKWKQYPDISPAEGITPLEGRKLFKSAQDNMMEVRPMMQVLGHFAKIGDKPQYQKYMVRVPSGNTTVDVRKPEAVEFVSNLVDEICSAFPAKFLNVDVTEIDDDGYRLTGTDNKELPDLLMKYISQLNDVSMRHGTRLMVAQCQLRAEGHLNGIGNKLDDMSKDIAVSSYYTAEFYGGWEHDFPLLQEKNIDYFVNPWIDSHARIMPYIDHAMDFSDITVKRGLQYGAMGSVTTDWGDAGHYQLTGVTIYPFMYHSASAWTGASQDREYFNNAFSRIMFDANDNSISTAISIVGNINGRPLKIINAQGVVETPPYVGNSTLGWYFNEFFDDPFTDPKIKQIADLEDMGKDILNAGNKSVEMLEKSYKTALRNNDVVDQLLFAARNYQAMGRKLIILSEYNDLDVSRTKVAADLIKLADTYQSLKEDFRRLWLKDCKDAGTFSYLQSRFDQTINPCREMAAKLTAANNK